jgi:hypothetical protein
MTEDAPLLLVVATGPQPYREYLLRSIATRYRIHLISATAPSWELAHLDGHTVVPRMATDKVLAAAQEVASQQRVTAVLSWHEEHILQAAMIAEALGLPGSSVAAVRRCRDKFETRTTLAARHLPQPEFMLVGTLDEAFAAADKLGYPAVLKPRSAGGSQGVVLVRDPAELTATFTFAKNVTIPHVPEFEQPVLVEEYLDAPEISIDSVLHAGRLTPLFLGRKEVGFPPYFEETGHLVSGRDPLLSDPGFVRTLSLVHEALGYTDGWTHSEFKLTADGPKLIEVNGRLGGDLIPYLGLRAAGINPGLIAAAVACGEPPDMPPAADSVAGVRFCYPPRDDTAIESVAFDRAALPAEIDLAVPLAKPGDVVSPPPKGIISGRLAMVTVVAPSAQRCRAALDEAQAALRVDSA